MAITTFYSKDVYQELMMAVEVGGGGLKPEDVTKKWTINISFVLKMSLLKKLLLIL